MLACHARNSGVGGFTTAAAHRPATHRAHMEWMHTRSPMLDYEGPERFITRTDMGIGCEYPGPHQPPFGIV
jgi:hypothetical protein